MGQHRERFELARSQFAKALARLHEVLAEDETSIIRDALIQRFEFTFELAWKSMFYWLQDQGENVPQMIRPVLQAAFVGQLIADPEVWERIKTSRDETSHTYNESNAINTASLVRMHAVEAFDRLNERLGTL